MLVEVPLLAELPVPATVETLAVPRSWIARTRCPPASLT